MKSICVFATIYFLWISPVWADRAAAVKYFTKDIKPLILENPVNRGVANVSTAPSTQNSGLGVFAGIFSNGSEDAQNQQNGWTLRLHYRRHQQVGDTLSRGYQLELQKSSLEGKEAAHVSFLWSFRFPKETVLPVYLGLAFGPGFYSEPFDPSSRWTVGLKGYGGIRMKTDLSQFYVEGGVQNQFLVLSNTLFEGWFFTSGVAYTF